MREMVIVGPALDEERRKIRELRRLTRAQLAALVNPLGFEFDPADPWTKDDAIAEYLGVTQ